DWVGAIEAYTSARRLHGTNGALPEIGSELSDAVLAQIEKTVSAGRLDLACLLLDRLRAAFPDSLQVREWSGFLDECRAASQAAAANQPRRCVEVLRRLAA